MTANEFVQFYAASMRGPLFTAFLSLGGFIFSMKTFIVVKMKEGVYSTDAYQDRIRTRRKSSNGHTYYGGLRRLASLLTAASALCCVASVAQFTLGLAPRLLAVVTCLGLAAAAVVLLGYSLYLCWRNLQDWFQDLELEAVRKEAALAKQGSGPRH